MPRIKGIAEQLEAPAVQPLASPVEPDGDQGQQSKSLLHQFKLEAEQLDGVEQSTQQLYMDPPQADQQPGLAPQPLSRKR